MLDFIENVEKAGERIDLIDKILGKGAMMPNNATNSGSRKIMQSTQLEHAIPPIKGELPLLQTGFENQFGEWSSSFVKVDYNYKVLAVIQKYKQYNNHHYYLIVENLDNGTYDVIERKSYKYVSESYGFIYNSSTLDSKAIKGATISKDTVIKKSLAFDEYNNRMDGVNLLTGYLSCEFTKEDSIILSETAAKKLSIPLVSYVTIHINDNNIPLNLYGNDSKYQIIPDIAQDVVNGTICALRSEKKEEALYMQNKRRLKTIMMSDEVFTVNGGKIYDINVYCNNKDNLESPYLGQMKYYYDETTRFNSEFVYEVGKIIDSGKCSYKLENMYYDCKKILEDGKYVKDREFSNIVLELVIIEEVSVSVGDKVSNRYGGKGVVSKILPDELMPLLDDGRHIEQLLNPAGMPNRENPGQSFEVEFNFAASRITQYMNSGLLSDAECLNLYSDYLKLVDPNEFLYIKNNYLDNFSEEQIHLYLQGVMEQGIVLSLLPISEGMDIDLLSAVYKHFPMVKPYAMYTPVTSSTGKIRYIESRKRIVAGAQYTYRLKQYAEEKFSATSLSSTNIKNENSRNQDKKNFKSPYKKTPIRFGYMEMGDLGHIGMEATIINLMLNAASPHARRLTEQLFTEDPFNVDIKLDEFSKNRGVEILNAYLTTMGLRLVFKKTPKVYKPAILIDALNFSQMPGLKEAIFCFNKGEKLYRPDPEKYYNLKQAIIMETIRPVYVSEIGKD